MQWLLFGAVFMLAAAYTLQVNAHVRIDIVSSRLTKRTRDIIDAVCHILMLAPLAAIMIWLSIPFVWDSYTGGEMSTNAGGLLVWPAKFLVLAGFVLLLPTLALLAFDLAARRRSLGHAWSLPALLLAWIFLTSSLVM